MIKKVLNEEGIVTGLLPVRKLLELKTTFQEGGKCFYYLKGWVENENPLWNSEYAYKVEVGEAYIPDIEQFESGQVLHHKEKNMTTVICSIDRDLKTISYVYQKHLVEVPVRTLVKYWNDANNLSFVEPEL